MILDFQIIIISRNIFDLGYEISILYLSLEQVKWSKIIDENLQMKNIGMTFRDQEKTYYGY